MILGLPFTKTNRQHGGAAMEYLIVSTCAALLAVAAATFVTKVFKERMDLMTEKLQTDDPISALTE